MTPHHALLAALTLAAVPSALARPCPATPAIAALEHQGLEFLNATRADPRYRAETQGRARPLRLDAQAAEVARCHSEAMARAHALSHSGPDGASPGDRLTAAGLDWTAVGENVAMAADLATADRILMQEPPFQPNHRANILNPAFTRVGVGVARSSDGLVWVTEDFYAPAGGEPPTPAASGEEQRRHPAPAASAATPPPPATPPRLPPTAAAPAAAAAPPPRAASPGSSPRQSRTASA